MEQKKNLNVRLGCCTVDASVSTVICVCARLEAPPWYSSATESSASFLQRGCDQSLQSEMFTIPACVLNSRPDQPAPHQRPLCSPQHPLSVLSGSRYIAPAFSPPRLSPHNFYFIFFIPQLHLISLCYSEGVHAVT